MADETRSGPEPDTRADRGDCPNPIHDHQLAASPMVAMSDDYYDEVRTEYRAYLRSRRKKN